VSRSAKVGALTGSRRPHVVVVGAGVGGLSAALDLAAGGARVTLLERQQYPGGKMRELAVGNSQIDAGPTVFTMRHVFDDLFAAGGRSFEDYVRLHAAQVLARHSWPDGGRLDLFADLERSVDAIGAFAGQADADAYRRFARRSQEIFDTLDHSFMCVERPGPIRLSLSMGLGGLPRLAATRPFVSLWRELGRFFGDPRLRQLFGRYATYCGSSPFAAPATLMLIAHAERAGVWFVDGGMRRLADAMTTVLRELDVDLRFGTGAKSIVVDKGAVTAVELDSQESVQADAVVFNGDAAALSAGLLGERVRDAQPDRSPEDRSLSAITWCMNAKVDGFPLDHHNVFFGSDYADEFDSIFERSRIGREPTVYICAQDRGTGKAVGAGQRERLLLLINAPPVTMTGEHVRAAGQRAFELLERQGLRLDAGDDHTVVTTPNDYAELFPASRGAIYGWPTHGWSGSFRRAGSGTRIGGLFLAGGTVHPGPGVPMVALSGRIAADAARQYLRRRSC
jgi:1-hydroxycarotenoid 3,4-desaturase